jgi:hypothetical protein
MRLDGARMLTTVYEREPGWSDPCRFAPTTRAERSRPSAARAAPSGSVARWNRGPRMARGRGATPGQQGTTAVSEPQLDRLVLLAAAGQATARKALSRQRFGVRVPGGAPPSAQLRPATTAGLLVCLLRPGPRWAARRRAAVLSDGATRLVDRFGLLVLPPRSGWRDLAGRSWHARPQPQAPHQPTRHPSRPMAGSLIQFGQLPWLRRQPHRPARGPLHGRRDRPGGVRGGGVGAAGAGGVVLHRGRVAGPGRACRPVALEGQPGRGGGPAPATELDRRGWQCPLGRGGRGRGAGTEPALGDGNDDQGAASPGPVAIGGADRPPVDHPHMGPGPSL